MSSSFPQFQSLPPELQLMVFEEFLLESLKPRIVLLDLEEAQVFTWDAHLLGWQWRVQNRERLQAESPATLAAILLEVNSTARSVANKFLERFGCPVDPPTNAPALMGTELGLSLSNDLFWLPDDPQRFATTHLGPGPVLASTDNENIAVVILSLESFEEVLRWAMEPWGNFDTPGELWTRGALKVLLLRFLDYFPAAWKLIITVDVPRSHISWDQLQEVEVSDVALLRRGVDKVVRCYSAYNAYEMLQKDLRNDESGDELLYYDLGWSGRAFPELSFAVPRPA